MKSAEFEYLVDALKSLPSIGTKVAQRIAYFLIDQDGKYINEFIDRIENAKKSIKFCKQCNNFSFDDLCSICANKLRYNHELCIVSSIDDLNKIESTNAFSGLYFVLNCEMDIKKNRGLEPLLINKLLSFISKNEITTVTLATNLTHNGEATALYIKNTLKNIDSKINIYRIAVGLPINSSLDYADDFSLKSSIVNKIKL